MGGTLSVVLVTWLLVSWLPDAAVWVIVFEALVILIIGAIALPKREVMSGKPLYLVIDDEGFSFFTRPVRKIPYDVDDHPWSSLLAVEVRQTTDEWREDMARHDLAIQTAYTVTAYANGQKVTHVNHAKQLECMTQKYTALDVWRSEVAPLTLDELRQAAPSDTPCYDVYVRLEDSSNEDYPLLNKATALAVFELFDAVLHPPHIQDDDSPASADEQFIGDDW